MITERRFKNAVKAYNKLMYKLCIDFLTIGTNSTEDPETKSKWNLRDLVSECQYQLNMYYEEGTSQWEALHALDDWPMTAEDLFDKSRFRTYMMHVDEVKVAKAEIKALKGFINRYKNDVKGMECYEGHCSEWD